VFQAPRALVWALVADTNRWDRASGLTPGQYRFKMVDGKWSRTATARELGMDMEWIEPAYRWIEGRLVHGERRFLRGPVATGGFQAHLEDVAGGTEVDARAYVTGTGVVAMGAGAVMKLRFGSALDRYLDAIGEVLARGEADPDAGAPAVIRARRALLAGYDAVTSGPRTPANERELEHRAGRLATMGAVPEIAQALVRHLRERPDEEVTQMRPFELARLWRVDRRETLGTFLRATRAGLVDLRWQLNCPVCRVSAGVATSLDEVRENVHCEACNIDYGIDFAKHVEAVFSSNAAVREVVPQVYCASSPSFLPHVFAQLRVAPGDVFEDRTALPHAALHVRTLGAMRTADVDIERDDTSLVITATDDGLAAEIVAGDGEPKVRFENRASAETTVLVERAAFHADAVLGSIMATFPDFIDLFATEAPASGVELSIGEVALLFSDLTGSTALYERVGDARAFALVEEHFSLMERIVHAHEGAIVKTMGDAVMACFAVPRNAVAAALEMVPENARVLGEHGLAVRIGVHAGPCLAVRANDRLDYFGTTVNVTARLEGKALPGQIVITEAFAGTPSIATLLEGRTRELFDADLKGIRATQKLVRITC
jgi:class 3 adenylate cyclase